ncbi:ethylbenzene dehydrogenase-related protein, partial [Streptomyces niveiscabiei]|uniref:ethylbenzene dehydrogenase-related protein n=1 Tax=Streptomyces niveiscabiei TaxID=164115 RepID=UPI0038F64DB6
VVGYGRWAGGRWTLEVSRRLATGSAFDVEIRSGVLMWLATFDHAHKRHSRHLRPLRLQLE